MCDKATLKLQTKLYNRIIYRAVFPFFFPLIFPTPFEMLIENCSIHNDILFSFVKCVPHIWIMKRIYDAIVSVFFFTLGSGVTLNEAKQSQIRILREKKYVKL